MVDHHVDVRILICRVLDLPGDGEGLAGVVAAPAVMSDRRGGEREEQAGGENETAGSDHRLDSFS